MSRTLPLLLVALLLGACAPRPAPPTSDVAVYLSSTPMSGRDILAPDLGTLTLQPEPVISFDDILSYSASSHDLVVKPSAIKRVAALNVPVPGLGFVVCVDRQPLFAGAVWVLWSSLSFDGPTINLPLQGNETSLHIYSGYPGREALLPDDPRTDPRLLDAFRQSGKLR